MMLQEGVEETAYGRYLMFSSNGEDFGIAVNYVIDILKMQEITPVPGVPANIRGVINMRGDIITVVDVRMRFGYEYEEYNARTCIIVVEVKGDKVGLVVDAVDEVISILDDELVVPANTVAKPDQAHFFSHVVQKNGKNKLIVNCHAMLNQGGIYDDVG